MTFPRPCCSLLTVVYIHVYISCVGCVLRANLLRAWSLSTRTILRSSSRIRKAESLSRMNRIGYCGPFSNSETLRDIAPRWSNKHTWGQNLRCTTRQIPHGTGLSAQWFMRTAVQPTALPRGRPCTRLPCERETMRNAESSLGVVHTHAVAAGSLSTRGRGFRRGSCRECAARACRPPPAPKSCAGGH